MSIKIVLYTDNSYTNVVKEVGGFESGSDAAWYRDHDSGLAGKCCKLEQEYVCDGYIPPIEENSDGVQISSNGWVNTD